MAIVPWNEVNKRFNSPAPCLANCVGSSHVPWDGVVKPQQLCFNAYFWNFSCFHTFACEHQELNSVVDLMLVGSSHMMSP